MLPITIHLKTGCYACFALTFLSHAFAWPLHLTNIDVKTTLSKNSECKYK